MMLKTLGPQGFQRVILLFQRVILLLGTGTMVGSAYPTIIAMKLLRAALATLLVLVVLQAEAPLRVWRLRLTKSCPNCRLVGVDIRDADLSGANLKHADLRWARFYSVNLTNADLSGANLRHASMNNVTTLDAEFCGAIMMNSVKGYCRQETIPDNGVSSRIPQ